MSEKKEKVAEKKEEEKEKTESATEREFARIQKALKKATLPEQIVLRALQHFMNRYLKGADIEIEYNTKEPHFSVSSSKSLFLFTRASLDPISTTFEVYFEKREEKELPGEGYHGKIMKKRAITILDDERAVRIVKKLKEVFIGALDFGVIRDDAILGLFPRETDDC